MNKIDCLNRKIDEYTASEGFSGVIYVRKNRELVYHRKIGYADEEKKTPFSENSMFTIYSISKFLCAIGLLKLVDKGLASLSDHPSKYLPEASAFDSRITIFDVLHHTSGISDMLQDEEFFRLYSTDENKDVRTLIKLLSYYPQHFAPGTDAKYSNSNYTICALIIENVSKTSYAEYMKREVFSPLGMKNAVVDKRGLYIQNRVVGYERKNGKISPKDKCYFSMFGAGDVVATPSDVYCLYSAIVEKKLLSKKSWEIMLTPSPFNNMGCGCTVAMWHGFRRIVNNGGCDGFRAMHFLLPENDFDVIIISNYGFGEARNTIAEFIFEKFFENDGETVKIDMDKGYI